MAKFNVGETYSSNNYGDYIILEKYKGSKYKIKFLETGFENIVTYASIYAGELRDPYTPKYSGVGYLGEISTVGLIKELQLWRGMLLRCYDKDSPHYNLYGEKGVYVDKRWHCFKNFVDDLPKIEGYNKELFYQGKLELDKDFKSDSDNKMYSLETCKFIPYKENFDEMINRRKQSTSSQFLGVTKLYDGKWQVTVVYKDRHFYGGRYISEEDANKAYRKLREDIFNNPEKYLNKPKKIKMQTYVAVYKNQKLILVHEGLSDLCKKSIELLGINLNVSNVSAVCLGKNKQYKGFEFKYITKEEYDKFCKESETN